MNKQRKVLITITYNELGIIVDTKTDELGSSAQPEIIRCKDCVWWDNCPASTIAPTYHRCKRVGRMAMEERDYCSYAERKEDE